MSVGLRHLLIGLAVCAVLHVASRRTREITAARPEIAVATDGSFTRDGQYPGQAFANASTVRAWGSWSGSDDNEGTITIGPFSAPRVLRFGVSGYPNHDGNTLRVERTDQAQSLPIKAADAGERWAVVDFELPPAWEGRAIRITGRDTAKGGGGWFAVTEPIRGGRSDGNNALIQTLAAFALNGLWLGVVFCVAAQLLGRTQLAAHWIPLAAGAIVALCGYAAFWAYFINALLGVIVSWSVIVAAVCYAGRKPWARRKSITHDAIGGPGKCASDSTHEVATVLKLMLSIGAFHLALLHLFPTQHDFYTLAANRYREALPGDNVLPHVTAERLFASESLKNPIDEWLSSDRPPLQAGWQLLTWPAGRKLGLDRRTASGTSAVWFQLLWVAAAYGLLRSLAIERVRAAGWVAVLGLCGFFLQNTTYTWPKLSASAFAAATFALLLLPNRGPSTRTNAIWSGLFAALAWLSHGGVAFSFLALLPLLAWHGRGGRWRAWVPGAMAITILIAPWLAYQTFYDPPANRLFKWHLAGQPVKDPRSTWDAMRDDYAKLGWRAVWSNKVSNLHAQVFGDWRYLVDGSSTTVTDRRSQEFFHAGRALTWWPVLALFAVVTTSRRVFTRNILVLGSWLLLTILTWCFLMFGEYQAVVHHGSYALIIGLFVLFSVVIERSGRSWLAVIAVLQAITLATTWAVANAAVRGPTTGIYVVIASAAVLAAFIARAFFPGAGRTSAAASAEASPNSGRRRSRRGY